MIALEERYTTYRGGEYGTVECPHCNTRKPFQELVATPGNHFPGIAGIECTTTYYHCPECNQVVVFRRGDGSPDELVVNSDG